MSRLNDSVPGSDEGADEAKDSPDIPHFYIGVICHYMAKLVSGPPRAKSARTLKMMLLKRSAFPDVV